MEIWRIPANYYLRVQGNADAIGGRYINYMCETRVRITEDDLRGRFEITDVEQLDADVWATDRRCMTEINGAMAMWIRAARIICYTITDNTR